MNVSFEQLLDYARAHDADFDDLQQRFSCGRGCGLCTPYVRRALATNMPAVPLDDVESEGR